MSLLDGKYEIITQAPLGGGRTLFEATAPDGTLVQIEWFELDPSKEPKFERYRRVLKRLKRGGQAALYDVISRPGAHYVAWQREDGAQPGASDAAITSVLADHGFAPEHADVRRAGRRAVLYGLAWDGEPFPAPQPPTAPAPVARPARRPLPDWAISWGLTLALLVVAVLLSLGGFLRRANDRIVPVPDVVGQDVNAAATALGRLGLAVSPMPLGSERPAGTVLSLEPPPGTALRPGRSVKLTYALPPGQLAPTSAPQLVGLRYPDEVATALRGAGLELGGASHIQTSTPAGVVVAQSVPAGGAAGKGSAVDVLVSDGPAQTMTFLPRLVGLPVEDARYLAGVAGLSPDHILEDPVDAPQGFPGEVLSQTLAPYVAVPASEAVLRLVVQRGSGGRTGAAAVPNVVGLSEAQARTQAAGYDVQVTPLATANLPEGVVLQDPAPGADPGDRTLALTVNVHPVTLADPGVRVTIKEPKLRRVPFAWTIQPGIGQRTAEVYAQPLEGERTLVTRTTARGGQLLQGSWLTTYPGPVTFTLYLGGQPYGDPLFVP